MIELDWPLNSNFPMGTSSYFDYDDKERVV